MKKNYIYMDTDEKPSKEALLKTLKEVSDNCPTAVIGGSIAFISRGMLSREPKDIDVFLGYNDSMTRVGIMDCNISQIGSDTVTDINGEEIQRTAIKINGINVCVFKVKDEYLQFDEVLYEGLSIKAQKPLYGIEAKKVYAKKNKKHEKDLEEILTKMGV
jgi:hypothetical protein